MDTRRPKRTDVQRNALRKIIQTSATPEIIALFGSREQFDEFQDYALRRVGISYLAFFHTFHQYKSKLRLPDGSQVKGCYFDQEGYMRLL